MKLFNYLRILGVFTNANQVIELPEEPADRAEKKMLETAMGLIDSAWSRRVMFLSKREAEGESVDMAAEKTAFYPRIAGGKIYLPLQFAQDYLVRRMAAVQNNASIHNTKDVEELKEVFDTYGVTLFPEFKGFVFARLAWSAKPGQKPKLLVHAKDGEEDVCLRFEAAGELCQKFLMAAQAVNLKAGQTFDLSVEAVDPAVAKNKRAGKKVADTGIYVNHNLTLTANGKSSTGFPPPGQKFIQKPTMEYMEKLFRDTNALVDAPAKAA